MRVPILKQADYLIASLQPGLSDQEWLEFRDVLAEKVGRARTRGVVVDVNLLDVMDSFAVRTLRAIAATCRLRGARTVVVGVQPDVAFAMTQLGLTLADVETALDLEEGLTVLEDQRGSRRRRR
jgi:rsbT antagonist protein RsbS